MRSRLWLHPISGSVSPTSHVTSARRAHCGPSPDEQTQVSTTDSLPDNKPSAFSSGLQRCRPHKLARVLTSGYSSFCRLAPAYHFRLTLFFFILFSLPPPLHALSQSSYGRAERVERWHPNLGTHRFDTRLESGRKGEEMGTALT